MTDQFTEADRAHALMQGEQNAATDAYIEARPQLDSIHNRRIFEAGFERGWETRNTEIGTLRQRVKELEHALVSRMGDPAGEELAALKQAQGEPVGVVVELFRPHTTHSVQWIDACPVIGTKLYTSAPTIPSGENEAVRMFLMYYGGHSGVTIEGMRENLSLAGFDGCWPDWADDVGHLTKAGAQDWIKYLLFEVPKRTKAAPIIPQPAPMRRK